MQAHSQNGWVVIPKSSKVERLKENMDVLDFQLSESDLAQMRGWEENLATGWDPTVRP